VHRSSSFNDYRNNNKTTLKEEGILEDRAKDRRILEKTRSCPKEENEKKKKIKGRRRRFNILQRKTVNVLLEDIMVLDTRYLYKE
jgi:hypothetical protein